MIRVRGISKRFRGTVAVSDVSFEAARGSITYLLGPNGAGKSTTMRMIAGLTRPDGGTVEINGRSLRRLERTMREVRFNLDTFARNPKHTAAQHLTWQARLGGIPADEVGQVLARVGLSHIGNRLVGGFSLGMLQRLGIATALLGDPQTIVLDEPDNGLDVDGILWLRELLTGLAAQGRTLLVASHNLTEVEITADRIVIMGRGRILSDADRDETLALGSGPRRLESAYLAVTRGSVEYLGTQGDQASTGEVAR
ncbi:ABC transporter ATP-binding protein [Nocardia nova]|uniref:Putative ABC transporter, ATP-binding protein n=1 Tax=Nocardia nova SH22a TaxID=1415166 RepID=W5TIQ9_9NOCA|nr:ATP-binding cassette domain-containing protein [Nocardia nova]AHH19044.1 putative ABC transporter, ATP-binding protein [Nocardia nova SH22a]